MKLFRYLFEVLEMWRFSLTGNEKISECIKVDRKITHESAVICSCIFVTIEIKNK